MNFTAIECTLPNGVRFSLLHSKTADEPAGVAPATVEWAEAWKTSTLQSIIEISNDHGILFTLKPDGAIELANGFTADQAAQSFWQAMKAAAPQLFKEQTV